MALSKEQSDQLKAFFPVQAHEFLNGNTYIAEEAITNRLDDVDPSWTFVIMQEYTRDNFAIAVGRMTVCGVERDGVGMQPLTLKKKDGTIIDGTEPEKSAATDALKRAARLFGIGRYILEMGRAVTDYQSLAKWLNERGGQNTPLSIVEGANSSAGQNNDPIPPAAQNSVQTPLNGHGHDKPRRMGDSQWTIFRNDVMTLLVEPAAKFPHEERWNTVNALHSEGAFDGITPNEAAKMTVARLAKHREKKEKTS